jgi:glycosyltransferase 2 family protein
MSLESPQINNPPPESRGNSLPRRVWPDLLRRAWRRGHLAWLLLPLLLGWALKDIPFQDVVQSLARLQAWQLAVLLGLNGVILLLITSRWWLILRSGGHRLPYALLFLYRLAGFALSYFTPGPQVGGEPLQVLLLTRRHEVPAAAAISSVLLDKLLELFSNFAFLVLGLLVIFAGGLPGDWVPGWALPLVSFTLACMAAHLAALWRGKTPISWLVGRLFQTHPSWPLLQRVTHRIGQVEGEMAVLCQTQPRMIQQALGVSLLIWAGLLWEYSLMLSFVGINFGMAEMILALTLARLAFLVPTPGGLGALEASQVLAMQLLGVNPALGISLCLVMRGRDLIVGGAGLALWARVGRL